MSAIDFSQPIDKEENPADDHIVVALIGKFRPHLNPGFHYAPSRRRTA